jgi:hypothetical protein
MPIAAHNARLVRRMILLPAVVLAALSWSGPANAQTNNNTNANLQVFNIVGGVSIDAAGILTNTSRDKIGKLSQILHDAMDPVPGAMNQSAGLRKVSLRGLEAAIKQLVQAGKDLPTPIVLMAGLQRIDYVLVYPDQKDIVLMGPAEGWRLDPQGYYVGVTTGQPVMLLDDFLVSLRAALNAPSVLSCSINPTPEGIRRVESMMRQIRGADAHAAAAGIEEQLGPQTITVRGVSDSTHFARVMVGADYRMKRVSLALDPSPVHGLPSYVEMAKATGSGVKNMMPRWWLEPNYKPLLRDDAGLAWEVRGSSVRCQTENDYLDAAGVAHPSGRTDAISQRWADLMTSRYEDLAVADPVFGQLRNCMDVAVVTALIAKQRLLVKSGASLPLLSGEDNRLRAATLAAPKQVATGASLVKKTRATMIAAGGVQINPWTAIDKTEKKADLAQVHAKASDADHANWWWD